MEMQVEQKLSVIENINNPLLHPFFLDKKFEGSFKERGARFTLMMLDEKQKEKGVIAASAGNHALALAYHGGQLGKIIDITKFADDGMSILKSN